MSSVPIDVSGINTDQRFNVSIELNVVTSSGTPFFDTKVAYSDVPYDGLVGIQRVLLGALDTLAKVGEAAVEAKGGGKK